MLDKMSNELPAAICQGTIGSFRTIPSRGVCVFTVETPIEQVEQVARIASHGVWVAVARIQQPEKPTEKEKRKWAEIPPGSQAAILCEDTEFQEFLGVKTTEEAIQDLYKRFDIASRSQISTNSRATRQWSSLVNEFRIWQQARP